MTDAQIDLKALELRRELYKLFGDCDGMGVEIRLRAALREVRDDTYTAQRIRTTKLAGAMETFARHINYAPHPEQREGEGVIYLSWVEKNGEGHAKRALEQYRSIE